MIYFLLNLITWTLALYGLLEIIKTIMYTYTYNIEKPEGIYIIIATKNQEKNIEFFLRANLPKLVYNKEEKNIKDIILVDLSSTDATKEIMERISKENGIAKVVEIEECKSILENINNEKAI